MTTALQHLRTWMDGNGGHRSMRLVKVDLVIAAVALVVILGVTAADHAAQGTMSALAGLLGG